MMRMATGIVIGIAVVAAIMLGALSYFAKPTFPIDSEAAAIQLSNAHIWVASNGTSSIAGFVVESIGSKMASIEKITVRGQSVPMSSWYYNNDPSIVTPTNIKRDLTFDETLERIEVTGGGSPEQFTRASGNISLNPGQVIIIYLTNPANITANDSGLPVTLNVEGGKARSVHSVYVSNG